MEPHFGSSVVSRARLHTGGESAQAASDLGAKAFTDGDNVHFGVGEFKPGTKEGDRLLAHELTHVADGSSALSRKEDPAKSDAGGPGVTKPSDPAEKAADAKGDAVANALHPPPDRTPGPDHLRQLVVVQARRVSSRSQPRRRQPTRRSTSSRARLSRSSKTPARR
jgi:hypothetical protein